MILGKEDYYIGQLWLSSLKKQTTFSRPVEKVPGEGKHVWRDLQDSGGLCVFKVEMTGNCSNVDAKKIIPETE